MKSIEKGWDEFWANILQIRIFKLNPKQNSKDFNKLINHIINSAKLSKSSSILDLACGSGIKTIKFAEKGISVTGIDYSEPLINYCEKLANELNVKDKTNFIKDNIINISFKKKFDCVTILGKTFGLFDYKDNIKILNKINDSLKDGGYVFIDLDNPLYALYNTSNLINKHWIEFEEGFLLIKSIFKKNFIGYKNIFKFINKQGLCINFNYNKSKYQFVYYYFLSEIKRMLDITEFKFDTVSGSIEYPPKKYSKNSRRMIVTAKKYKS